MWAFGSRSGRFTFAAAALAVLNLGHYKLNPYAFQRTIVVDRPELFDAAPERDGTVPAVPGFSYRLLHPISDLVFQRYFDGLPRSGDALEDALAVARRVRALYVHGKFVGELYPWIADRCIPKATRRPVLCGTYARTQVSALEHLGHVSRVVYLEGHIAPEVFDFERRRWLYVDPNGGIYVSTPEGSILSLAQLVERLRLRQAYVVHRIDDSTDDRQFTLRNLPKSGAFLSGYLAYQDGPGMQYRRKSLFYTGRLATLVVFRQPHSPLVLDGMASVLFVNAMTAGALTFFFLRERLLPPLGTTVAGGTPMG